MKDEIIDLEKKEPKKNDRVISMIICVTNILITLYYHISIRKNYHYASIPRMDFGPSVSILFYSFQHAIYNIGAMTIAFIFKKNIVGLVLLLNAIIIFIIGLAQCAYS